MAYAERVFFALAVLANNGVNRLPRPLAERWKTNGRIVGPHDIQDLGDPARWLG